MAASQSTPLRVWWFDVPIEERWKVEKRIAENNATGRLTASPPPANCPPALPGFQYDFQYQTIDGTCWCVYASTSNPNEWYEERCLT